MALVLIACSPAGAPQPAPEVVPEPAVVCPEVEPPQAPEVSPLELVEFPDPLTFDADSELMPALEETVFRYKQRLGIDVEFAAGGIPWVLEDSVTYRGQVVDALAHYDRICAYSGCNQGHGVFVVVASYMLTDKAWALQNTVDHEAGHIISGWGVPGRLPMHLATGNMMAPGCVNHVCSPWTMDDATLLCSGAPCEKIELEKR